MFTLSIISLGSLLAVLLLSDYWVRVVSEDKLISNMEELPCHDIGVVLGSKKTLGGGRINLFFKYRIEAAAELYHAGKIKHIILSGDNHKASYDEPTDMKEELMKLGVPESAITLDFAGFRTLDSIVRANKIFGQQKFLVISQQFHNERAVFIAKHHQIEAMGFNAQKVNRRFAPKTYLREYPARVKAMMDVYLFGVQPKFLGEQIHIPIPTPCES